jgi:hypothetical protein
VRAIALLLSLSACQVVFPLRGTSDDASGVPHECMRDDFDTDGPLWLTKTESFFTITATGRLTMIPDTRLITAVGANDGITSGNLRLTDTTLEVELIDVPVSNPPDHAYVQFSFGDSFFQAIEGIVRVLPAGKTAIDRPRTSQTSHWRFRSEDPMVFLEVGDGTSWETVDETAAGPTITSIALLARVFPEAGTNVQVTNDAVFDSLVIIAADCSSRGLPGIP